MARVAPEPQPALATQEDFPQAIRRKGLRVKFQTIFPGKARLFLPHLLSVKVFHGRG